MQNKTSSSCPFSRKATTSFNVCPFAGVPSERAAVAQPKSKALNRVNNLLSQLKLENVQESEEKQKIYVKDLPGPHQEDSEAYNIGTHHFLSDLHDKYGDRFMLPREGSKVLFVRDFPSVRRVLMSEDFAKTWDVGISADKDVDYVMNLVQPVLKGTVFNLNVESTGSDPMEAALEARRNLRPMFGGKKAFEPIVNRVIVKALEEWKAKIAQNSNVDVLDMAHDVIRRAVLVLLCGSMAETANSIAVGSFCDVMNYFVKRYGCGPGEKPFDPAFSKEDKIQMEKLRVAGEAIVAEYRRQEKSGELGTSPADTLCGLKLMTAKGYPDSVCGAMLVNTVIAGGEAPASVFGQLLQEIGFNPEVQAKLHEDVKTTDSSYTRACVLEALRLYAPATLVQRQALFDMELPGGLIVPAGTVVGICVPAVNRDPRNWSNPLSFNAERGHMDVVTTLNSTRSLLSFSGGTRGCPGRHLGVLILNSCLKQFMIHFAISGCGPRSEWHPKSQGHGVRKFAEWPVHGIPMTVRERPVHHKI